PGASPAGARCSSRARRRCTASRRRWPPRRFPTTAEEEPVNLDRARTALIVQDMQNDIIMEGGAFADSGAPAHATSQNVVEKVKGLAAAARKAGVAVIPGCDIGEHGTP